MRGTRPWFGGLALVLCLLLLAAPARGEDAPPPGGDGASGVPSEVRLDEQVVRLPRTDPAGPGGSASVVDAERFAGEAKSVAELVATAPGVAVRDYGGLGQAATASIRGSTSDGVLVLLDGLPLQTAFGGGVDLSTIPRQWISSIEVVRGVEGARFGSGALGGALNIVTRPAGGASRWNAQLSGGSFGTVSAGADASFGGERSGLLLSLGWDRTDGDFHYSFDPAPSVSGNPLEDRVRQNANAERGGVLVKGFVDAGGGRVDALAQLSAGTRGLPGWPHDLTPNDRQDDLRAMGVVRFAHPAWDRAWWKLEGTVRHDALDARLAALGSRTAHQRGTSGLARAGLTISEGAHALELGAEAGGEELSATDLGATRQRATFAATAADEIALGNRVRLRPALRAERVGPFSGWSASAGLDARLAGPLSARASVGRTFRAPSFAELYLQQGLLAPNPALVPEEALGGSAGLVAEGRLGLASATAFATLYRDLIVYEAATFQRLKPFNAGKATVRGLELEAASTPLTRLRASGSLAYTLLVSENLRGEDAVVGRELPRRPRHRLYARAGVEPGPVELHVETQLVGRQFLDSRNLAVIPRAVTVGAGASVRVARRPDLRLHLDVRNLLDDRTLEDGFGNPLPSRMVLLGLRAGSPQEGTP